MWRLALVQFFSMLGLKLWPHVDPFFKRYRKVALVLFFLLLLGAVSTFFVGCVSYQQKNKEGVSFYKYKADIEINIGGKDFIGMAVSQISDSIPISIKSRARFDMLKITTCHREDVVDKDSADWAAVRNNRRYAWVYNPVQVEKEKFCPIYIQAMNKDGVTAWGYIALRTNEFFPAKMNCNGESVTWAGISVCQAAIGLEQMITFSRAVKYAATPECQIKQKSEREFYLRGTEGFCQIEFTDMLHQDMHRVVFENYYSPLLRSE